MRRHLENRSISALEDRGAPGGLTTTLVECESALVVPPRRHDPRDEAPEPHPEQRAPSPRALRRRLVAADAAALGMGALLAVVVQRVVRPSSFDVIASELLLLGASIPGFVLGGAASNLHRARANDRPGVEATNILKTVAAGIASVLLIALVVQYRDVSRLWILSTAGLMFSAMIVERRIARTVFARLRSQRRLTRRIVIVGIDDGAITLQQRYQRKPEIGYHVVGLVDAGGPGDIHGANVLGRTEDLQAILVGYEATGVVISVPSVPEQQVNLLTRRLTDRGYHVALSSSLSDIDVSRLRPQTQDGQTLIYVEPVIRTGWRGTAKRIVDVGMAASILVVTLPLMLAAVVAIKVSDRGPAFFRQIRIGRDGMPFDIIKLRTMVIDAESRRAALEAQNEADGPLFKMRTDPRITRVGRILRKLSIDELPQLVCVLRGTMSMVGPRPALPDEVAQWDDDVRERLRVLPGLTGLWQVSGRSDSSFEVYKRMDLYYVDNWSLLHDLRICALTVRVVLTGHGAS